MIIVIVYDITDNKRRTKLHKFLKNYGIPTQYSVFECKIDQIELKKIKRYCKEHLNADEDSVRIYKICSRCMSNAVVQGKGIKLNALDWEII